MPSSKPIASENLPADVYEFPEVPERNLLAAMLERAIRDVLNKPDQQGAKDLLNTKYCREALGWLRAQSSAPGSFRWVCHHLDISPKVIRRYIYEAKNSGKRYDVFEGVASVGRGVRLALLKDRGLY